MKKLSVALYNLIPDADVVPDLFADEEGGETAVARRIRLSCALDSINHRFGRDSVLIGMLPSSGRSFSGSKIAFTRIPDREEFFE